MLVACLRYNHIISYEYVGTRKAINRNWSNQKQHIALKTKMILIKNKNRPKYIRTKGQSSGQLFLKRWPLSNPNRTKSIMNKHKATHHQNSDTKTNTYYN